MQGLDTIIERLMWGKCLCDIQDATGCSRPFILRSLSIKESNLVEYIYKKEYNKSINAGLLKQIDLENLYNSMNVWTEDDENDIKVLELKIKQLKFQIRGAEFFTDRKRIFERELNKINKELSQKLIDKNELFANSAEMRSEEIKRRYIVFLSTENEMEERYWKTHDDFLKEDDFILIYNLALTYYKNNYFDEKTLREVARNPAWRIRWSMAKNGADLFGRPVCNFSEMQNMIVYWSQVYDFVYDSMERPSDGIIENDAACDAWIEEQSRKNKSNATPNDTNLLGTKKSSTKMDHNEQFIMVAPGDKEVINRVHEMNPKSIRQKLKNEYNKIKKEGKISEWGLRKNDYI